MLGESTRSGNRSGDHTIIQPITTSTTTIYSTSLLPNLTDVIINLKNENQEEREEEKVTAMDLVMDSNFNEAEEEEEDKRNGMNSIDLIQLESIEPILPIVPTLMTRHSRIIKKPNKYFDTLPSTSNTQSIPSTPLGSPTKSSHSRRTSINTLTPPTTTIIPNTIPPITLNFTSLSSSSNVISSPLQFSQPPISTTSLSLDPPPSSSINNNNNNNNSLTPLDKKRHPRDLVPQDVGFPTLATQEKVQRGDREDRILMAMCRILLDHGNRALCPKEIADVMEERGWLLNAGTTPFAHISTCIRSHLKRSTLSTPPYPSLLISFELSGAITPLELSAIGLNPDEAPAVKRGTLWYLDERALGKGVGAEDPFNRVRREGGLEEVGREGVYSRGFALGGDGGRNFLSSSLNSTFSSSSMGIPMQVDSTGKGNGVEGEEDDNGMGRGKRKRRASTAATSGTLELLTPSIISHSSTTLINSPIPLAGANVQTIPKYKHIVGQAHHWSTTRKNQAAAAAASASELSSISTPLHLNPPAPTCNFTSNTTINSIPSSSISLIDSSSSIPKSTVPRLRLRLSSLEEIPSPLSPPPPPSLPPVQESTPSILSRSHSPSVPTPTLKEERGEEEGEEDLEGSAEESRRNLAARYNKKPRRAASEGGRWVISRGGGPVRVGRGRPRIDRDRVDSISSIGSSRVEDRRRRKSREMEVVEDKIRMEEGSSGSEVEVMGETEREGEREREKEGRSFLSNSTPAGFSSAASSALLAQSLLAVNSNNNSHNTNTSSSILVPISITTQDVISPNSLHFGSVPFDSRMNANPRHHSFSLSLSAPSPYSATTFTSLQFQSSRNPPTSNSNSTPISITRENEEEEDEEDQDDFSEAMLRGETFDFEWGGIDETVNSSSYSTPNSPLLLPGLKDSGYRSLELESVVGEMDEGEELSGIEEGEEEGEEEESKEERANSLGPPEEAFELDLDLMEGLEEKEADKEMEVEEIGEGEDGNASTPATTPRSPPAKEEEFIETPTTGTFRGGLEVTLCGVFAQEGEGEEDIKPQINLSLLDRTASTDSLTSLVEDGQDEPEVPITLSQLATVDATSLSLPLPSPLALELPPMLSLLNNAFSTDYDFVGHEEDDRSAYRGYSYDEEDQDHREGIESDEDEEDEDDEILTVKLEDDLDSPSPSHSTRSSRQSSTFNSVTSSSYPLESFSRRLMVTNLSSSSSSTGSETELFDPHMIVSNSILATGLAVDLVAPSPPELTEWGMSLDLDDLDVSLASDTELVGPETVGLDELDAAWGGYESDIFENVGRSVGMESEEMKSIEDLSASSFLTRSPINTYSPTMSPIRSIESSLSSLPLPSPLPLPNSILPPLSLSATTKSPVVNSLPLIPTPPLLQVTHPNPSSIIVYPTVPLSPAIVAKIVQKGVAVYSTTLTDSETHVVYSLLRRIDTDFVNGSVLLRLTSTNLIEREKILNELEGDCLRVLSGGPEIEGIWIPLSSARKIREMFISKLAILEVFLKDDLGGLFPAPIPSLRSNWEALNTNLLLESPSTITTTLPSVLPIPSARRGSNPKSNARRRSLKEDSERESSEEIMPVRIAGARGSRRN